MDEMKVSGYKSSCLCIANNFFQKVKFKTNNSDGNR